MLKECGGSAYHLVGVAALLEQEGRLRFETRDIWVQNHLIHFQPPSKDAIRIDMRGKSVCAPFFNTHCHLGESAYPRIEGDDWTLARYLAWTDKIEKNYSQEESASRWQESAGRVLEGSLKHGVTGICAARSAEICAQFGLPNLAGYPLMLSAKLGNFSKSGYEGFRSYRQKFESALCRSGIFFHSLYRNDETNLELARKIICNCDAFLTLHISEDEESTELEKSRWGKSAIRVLAENGLLTRRTLLVHGGCISREDWTLVAQGGCSLAVCPISSHFLNSRVADLPLLDRLGIPWFVGTDGEGTGRSLSLIRQLKYLWSLYPAYEAGTLFRAVTTAPASFVAKKIYSGLSTPGTLADFLVFNERFDNAEDFFRALICGDLEYTMERY